MVGQAPLPPKGGHKGGGDVESAFLVASTCVLEGVYGSRGFAVGYDCFDSWIGLPAFILIQFLGFLSSESVSISWIMRRISSASSLVSGTAISTLNDFSGTTFMYYGLLKLNCL